MIKKYQVVSQGLCFVLNTIIINDKKYQVVSQGLRLLSIRLLPMIGRYQVVSQGLCFVLNTIIINDKKISGCITRIAFALNTIITNDRTLSGCITRIAFFFLNTIIIHNRTISGQDKMRGTMSWSKHSNGIANRRFSLYIFLFFFRYFG